MSAELTTAQQDVINKVMAVGKQDAAFRNKLETNELDALIEAGLLDDYVHAFSDDVAGYIQQATELDGSTCCVSDYFTNCCVTCWFTDLI